MKSVTFMSATLNDICAATGLSKATVSRVLNDSPLVREDTRKRVLLAMEELDYHPSSAARALAGQGTKTIGVFSPYVGSGFFTELLMGMNRVAGESGFHVMTAFGHGGRDERDLLKRFIRERRVDALIVLNLDLPGSFLAEIRGGRMPMVVVDTPAVEDGIPSVSIDNRSGTDAVASHLLEHGYRDIAVFTGPGDGYDSRERLLGCRAALARAGCDLPARRILSGDFTMKSGRALVEDLLSAPGGFPEAIVCLNDAMALGALGVMRERGMEVPRDVALAGFDDCEAAALVGLTTVNVPLFDMGREAALLALASLEEDMSGRHTVIPSRLVVRETCGCGRGTGHNIQQPTSNSREPTTR